MAWPGLSTSTVSVAGAAPKGAAGARIRTAMTSELLKERLIRGENYAGNCAGCTGNPCDKGLGILAIEAVPTLPLQCRAARSLMAPPEPPVHSLSPRGTSGERLGERGS